MIDGSKRHVTPASPVRTTALVMRRSISLMRDTVKANERDQQ